MNQAQARPAVSHWLFLIVPAVIVLIALEVGRYMWLTSTLRGYAYWAPVLWAIAEVIVVLVVMSACIYYWRAKEYGRNEQMMADNRTLQDTIRALREENTGLKEANDAQSAEGIALQETMSGLRQAYEELQVVSDKLSQENVELKARIETLQTWLPPTFVRDDHPSLMELLLRGELDELEALGYLRQAAGLLSVFHSSDTPYVLAPDTIVVNQAQRAVYLRQRIIDARTALILYAGFSPPEALRNPPTIQGDVFGLGALLYALYTRQMPPAGEELTVALEHLNVQSKCLGVDYLLRKSLWPQAQFRLGTATDFDALLEHIIARQPTNNGAIQAVKFDIGADFNVGLHKGRNRGHNARDNEDRLFWDMDEEQCLCLLAIADGVTRSDVGTGYSAAALFTEQASRLWQELQKNRPLADCPEDSLSRLFANSNHRIVEAIAQRLRGCAVASNEATMAAAACALLCRGSTATVANLGDVRAYLATPHWAGKITQDDSALSLALQEPSLAPEKRAALSGSMLSDHLGRWQHGPAGKPMPLAVNPHIATLELMPDETLVLASDGAYGAARGQHEPFEDTLIKILVATDSAQVAAFRLMSVANQRSGSDNISCIVCRCLAPDNDAPGRSHRRSEEDKS